MNQEQPSGGGADEQRDEHVCKPPPLCNCMRPVCDVAYSSLLQAAVRGDPVLVLHLPSHTLLVVPLDMVTVTRTYSMRITDCTATDVLRLFQPVVPEDFRTRHYFIYLLPKS
jgi:hypothetical protein